MISGLDYSEREKKAVKALKASIPASLKQSQVKGTKGLFVELHHSPLLKNHFIASTIDGVGSKVIIAIALDKFGSIGVDCVAMNANDLCTLPSSMPFLFLDYLACQSQIEEKALTRDIMKGIVKGLQQSSVHDILRKDIQLNLGKGETASMDEVIASPRKGYGFDLAGAMIGFVEKTKTKAKPKAGDKIIALKSSGPHSNGYTYLRTVLLNGKFEERKEERKKYAGKHSLDFMLPSGNGETIGEALLSPTRIYSKPLAEISKKFEVVGVNNTGYGLHNFNRFPEKLEFRITSPLKPQPIFDLMKKESIYSTKELYSKFNMGMGFFVIAKPKETDRILSILARKRFPARVVGEVKKSPSTRTVLVSGEEKIVFKGY